ncbi:MAG: tRNA (adenosine(37)-N6)-threonylcarbamoyltransferase complex ATPase subunit type 1 TsaE [Christensenellales bacterium]
MEIWAHGKTKFTEGILKHYNLEDEISSPTFTIVNEYNTPNFNIYHFDLYRLSDIDEFFAMGGEEYLHNGACIFEWGQLIEPILDIPYTKISFSRSTENPDYRILKIESK